MEPSAGFAIRTQFTGDEDCRRYERSGRFAIRTQSPVEDIKTLIRDIGIQDVAEAEAVVKRYYALDRYPARAQYVIEELPGA